jgi:hypothetical protein
MVRWLLVLCLGVWLAGPVSAWVASMPVQAGERPVKLQRLIEVLDHPRSAARY